MPPLNIQCWIQLTSRWNIDPCIHHHISSYHHYHLSLFKGMDHLCFYDECHTPLLYTTKTCKAHDFYPVSIFLVYSYCHFAGQANCWAAFSILQFHNFGCLAKRQQQKQKTEGKQWKNIRTQVFSCAQVLTTTSRRKHMWVLLMMHTATTTTTNTTYTHHLKEKYQW